jgi:integrase
MAEACGSCQAVQVVVAVVRRAATQLRHRQAVPTGIQQVAVARQVRSTLGDTQIRQPVPVVVAVRVRHAVRITVPILQQFATALRQKVSRKTVVQVLVTISGIQKYTTKQGVRAVVVSLKDLEIARQGAVARRPYFTKEQVGQIIGLQESHIKQCSRWRGVQRKFGIPTKDAGLHAFRHGLATELADKNTPIPVLQKQMRHADVRTTLSVYAHVIPQSQREAMEAVSIGTVPVMEQEQTASASK